MAPISHKVGYSGPLAVAAGGSREVARRLYLAVDNEAISEGLSRDP
jgi:hypothetical protein